MTNPKVMRAIFNSFLVRCEGIKSNCMKQRKKWVERGKSERTLEKDAGKLRNSA